MGCSRGDVGHMDYSIFDAVTVELLVTYALHQCSWFLRWQFFAGLPHRIFSSGPLLLVTPRLKVSLGLFGQKNPPCFLEIGAGLFEAGGGSVLMFARVSAWIETAAPLPRTLRIAIVPASTSP
jgi:hypothetical protein